LRCKRLLTWTPPDALEHRLGQPGQQPVRADQPDTIGAGRINKVLGKLLLINPNGMGSMISVTAGPSRQANARRVEPDQLHLRSD